MYRLREVGVEKTLICCEKVKHPYIVFELPFISVCNDPI